MHDLPMFGFINCPRIVFIGGSALDLVYLNVSYLKKTIFLPSKSIMVMQLSLLYTLATAYGNISIEVSCRLKILK